MSCPGVPKRTSARRCRRRSRGAWGYLQLLAQRLSESDSEPHPFDLLFDGPLLSVEWMISMEFLDRVGERFVSQEGRYAVAQCRMSARGELFECLIPTLGEVPPHGGAG